MFSSKLPIQLTVAITRFVLLLPVEGMWTFKPILSCLGFQVLSLEINFWSNAFLEVSESSGNNPFNNQFWVSPHLGLKGLTLGKEVTKKLFG